MKRPITQKEAVQRAATIRRQNVRRHDDAHANSRLRYEIQRHQANQTNLAELGRLQMASLRGNGLDQMALGRMNQLQSMVR